MDPTRDNPFIRFKAFIDGLGIFTVFAVIILVVGVMAALFGFFEKGEAPEDAAADIRYEIHEEIKASQDAVLTDEQIDQAMTASIAKLSNSKAVAVEDPSQLIPGVVIADTGEEVSFAGIDDLPVDPNEVIDPEQMKIGQAQYLVCAACHGQNGEGGPAGPPLAQSEWVTGPISNLIRIQLRGLKGDIEVNGKIYSFPAGMFPMAYQNDEQVAGVLTYIRNSFGNKASAVQPSQVAKLRSEVGKPQILVEELKKP